MSSTSSVLNPVGSGVAQHSGRSQGRSASGDAEQDALKLLALLKNTDDGVVDSDENNNEANVVTPGRKKPLPPINSSTQSISNRNKEKRLLECLNIKLANERKFKSETYRHLFEILVSKRLENREWCVDLEALLPLATFIRILLRDLDTVVGDVSTFEWKGLCDQISRCIGLVISNSVKFSESSFLGDSLQQLLTISQKLCMANEILSLKILKEYGLNTSLLSALACQYIDLPLLHATLLTLVTFSNWPECRTVLCELTIVDWLVKILNEYDLTSKRLAAKFLRLLCQVPQAKQMMCVSEGLGTLLGILHCDCAKLVWHSICCLLLLAEDSTCSEEIVQLGGLPILLKLLSTNESSNTPPSSAAVQSASDSMTSCDPTAFNSAGPVPPYNHQTSNFNTPTTVDLSMKSAVCSVLALLAINDSSGRQMVQNNAIYIIAKLTLPPGSVPANFASNSSSYYATSVNTQITSSSNEPSTTLIVTKPIENLQKNALRALRFLFSFERNRRYFKQMFTPEIFEIFIDIGHYVLNIQAYTQLVNMINALPTETRGTMALQIENVNINRNPLSQIAEYSVMERLGSGAFGSVYKVAKRSTPNNFLAMKEVNVQQIMAGRSSKEMQKGVDQMIAELAIIKQQLKHPNVVRYYKTFFIAETEKLYIVMELIEGASLQEHFSSLIEKKQTFGEQRLWSVITQLVLALRYLHHEKGICHRDLSPNNVMLGDQDKVTITDFGLAKGSGGTQALMTSVVGTILYCSPEMIQNQEYTVKTDVWSLGCLIFHMAALKPPFITSNMLALASKIVEAKYDRSLVDQEYDAKVSLLISRCLTPTPDDRPDIMQVAEIISSELILQLDRARLSNSSLQRKLERERTRSQELRKAAVQATSAQMKQVNEAMVRKSLRTKAPSSCTEDEGELGPMNGPSTANPDSRESSAGYQGKFFRNPSFSSREPTTPQENLPFAFEKSGDGGGNASSKPPLAQQLSPNAQGPIRQRHSSVSAALPIVAASSAGAKLLQGVNNNPIVPKRGCSVVSTPPSQLLTTGGNQSLDILSTIHKIFHITSLPPHHCTMLERRIVEKFRRRLFSKDSHPTYIHDQLIKVNRGANELVDLEIHACALPTATTLKKASICSSDSALTTEDLANLDGLSESGVTFLYLQEIIDRLASESGYFEVRETEKRPPYTSPAYRSQRLKKSPGSFNSLFPMSS